MRGWVARAALYAHGGAALVPHDSSHLQVEHAMRRKTRKFIAYVNNGVADHVL